MSARVGEMEPEEAGKALPNTLVELAISARNIRDADVLSKSDPMCVLYIKEFGQSQWREFGRTETIDNTLNPTFVKKFIIEYYFEEKQLLRFELYDIDSKSQDLKQHDALGCMECTLGNVVTCMKLTRTLDSLRGKRARGDITICAEELSGCKEDVTLEWCGRGLDKKDLLGKSDPFLEFAKDNHDGTFTVTHRTNVIKMNLNPNWTPFTLPVRRLCNGDYDRTIRVRCFDWNRNGSHSLIGEFNTYMRDITRGVGKHNDYTLINKEVKAKKGDKYKDSGKVSLVHIKTTMQHSFLDYLQSGLQIHVVVAIDFTMSNGDPSNRNSLHYLHPNKPSRYENSLHAVVDILEDYDSDRQIPAYGFGALVPPDTNVSNVFPLNGNLRDPNCLGTPGVCSAYRETLQRVKLYGPSNFAPIISHVASQAENFQHGDKYYILLIITDGELSDMPATKQAIIQASDLPLSIIIVGIGDDSSVFEAMNILDGDNIRLSYKGKTASRDIVQFVEMRHFEEKSDREEKSRVLLGKEVLREVPDQVCSFMKSKGIHPVDPMRRDSSYRQKPGRQSVLV